MAITKMRRIGWLILAGALPSIVIVVVLSSGITLAEVNTDSNFESPTKSDLTQFNATASLTETADCRVGVAVNHTTEIEWVDDFGAGWYVNFGFNYAEAGNGAERVPVISVRQDKNGSQYLDTFSVMPPLTDTGLGALVDLYPGTLWIVGNEPDRGPNPGSTDRVQDDTFPEIYAQGYYSVYHFIKDRDPSASIANAGLVGFTPNRQQYLDMVWQAYLDTYHTTMPVDVWNMHLYILPEVNPSGQPNGIANVALGTDPALGKSESYDPNNDPSRPPNADATCALDNVYCFAEHDDINLFDDHVRRMRQWMKDHGQQNKPLMLSEFSILYPYELDGGSCFLQDEFGNCFTPPRVINHLYNTVNYLESTGVDPQLGHPLDGGRMVQQWSWFSINQNNSVADVSNLVTNTLLAPTPLGLEFQNIVQARSQYKNLVAGPVSYPTAFSNPPGGTGEVTLKATLANNGNTAVENEFQVTFYKDISLTQEIDTVTMTTSGSGGSIVEGCVREMLEAEVTWSDLPPGLHYYWVKIDSANEVEENPPSGDGEADNIASGFVIIDPGQMMFPVARKPG